MAPLFIALVKHKQAKYDNAAVAAIVAHDTRARAAPVHARLDANDKAVIAKDPDQFDVCLLALSCIYITNKP
jgi:hypothetical protein